MDIVTKFMLDEFKQKGYKISVNGNSFTVYEFPINDLQVSISHRADIDLSYLTYNRRNALKTYLRNRYTTNGEYRIFFNYKKINIYFDRRFKPSKDGEFEDAMWRYSILDNIKDTLVNLDNILT